jgi:hypothetical protein
MGWFLFFLLLIAIALGVAGTVIKVTAVIVLTILASIAALILLTVLAVRFGWWRFNRNLERHSVNASATPRNTHGRFVSTSSARSPMPVGTASAQFTTRRVSPRRR